MKSQAPATRTPLQPASDLRLERLKVGVPLDVAARAAGISVTRASFTERYPERAYEGDVRKLRAVLPKLAAQRSESRMR